MNEKPNIVAKIKWEEDLGIDNNIEWEELFILPILSRLNARAIYFQIQILHRTLITNRKLKQFKIRDNDLCDNCNEPETISHLLFDCEPILELWIELGHWLDDLSPKDLYLFF